MTDSPDSTVQPGGARPAGAALTGGQPDAALSASARPDAAQPAGALSASARPDAAQPDLSSLTALRRLRELLIPLGERPTVVGLDVDGTLLGYTMRMSPAVQNALTALNDTHHSTVIATGRGLSKTLPIVHAAGVRHGYAVSANGAVTARIVDGDHEIVDTRTFNPAAALEMMHEAVPGARHAIETVNGDFYATESFRDTEFGIHAQQASFEELIQHDDVIRVVVTKPDMPIEEFRENVQTVGLHGVQYAVGRTAWLDLAAPGVTKASALATVADRLGIDQLLALGDGDNDREMLRAADVGIAMGQASDFVKESADAVTASIDADGAAIVLNLLMGREPFAESAPGAEAPSVGDELRDEAGAGGGE